MHLVGEDEMVWNLMKLKKKKKKKVCRDSRAPIGAMFEWNPNLSFKVFLCKTSALVKNLIVKNILNRKFYYGLVFVQGQQRENVNKLSLQCLWKQTLAKRNSTKN